MRTVKNTFAGRATDARDVGFDYRRKVGTYVRDARLAAGLTQEELARQLNIRNTAISAIELGRNPIPPERYKAFAMALQIDPVAFGWFLQEHTDPWLYDLIHGTRRANRLPSRLGADQQG